MDASVQVIQEKDYDKVVLVGPINEEAEIHLAKLPDALGKKIVINFKQVTSINSLGVRAWINFVRALNTRSVEFEECTPEIVSQMNMIPNFKGNAVVKSVYGTYFCEKCNNSQEELFVVGKNFPHAPDYSVHQVSCKQCGNENIDFEEVEDSFFAFAS